MLRRLVIQCLIVIIAVRTSWYVFERTHIPDAIRAYRSHPELY